MDLKETVDMHTKKLEQHDKELVELRKCGKNVDN